MRTVITGILCFVAFSVVAFYTWSFFLYDPYTIRSMDDLQREYNDALNDPLKTEESLLQSSPIATASRNIELYPNESQYHFERAELYRESARQDLAIPDYDNAINLTSTNVIYYWKRGRAYWVLKQYRRALSDYDKAIELEIPKGFKEKSKVNLLSYELDKMREQRKELIKDIDFAP